MNKWVVSVGFVLALIFSVLGVKSHIEYNNFNPEEHTVHQKHNGTNEFEFDTSDEVQYFGVYVKGDVECERMGSNEIDIGRGLISWNEWNHDCSTSYDTDEYTYVGYVDLTTEKAGEYHIWGDFDTILLVDMSEMEGQPFTYIACYMLAIIGIVTVFVGWRDILKLDKRGTQFLESNVVWIYNNSLNDESE